VKLFCNFSKEFRKYSDTEGNSSLYLKLNMSKIELFIPVPNLLLSLFLGLTTHETTTHHCPLSLLHLELSSVSSHTNYWAPQDPSSGLNVGPLSILPLTQTHHLFLSTLPRFILP
jgi:hypothetical protein